MSDHSPSNSNGGTPTGVRRFAEKKTNLTASEMRNMARLETTTKKSLASASVEQLSTPTASGESIASAGPATANPEQAQAEEVVLVEAIDYDKLLKEKKKLIDKDNVKNLLLFPEDDIAFETVQREYRTVRSSLPKQASTEQNQVYMNDVFDFYTADWSVVNNKNAQFSHYPRSSSRQIEDAPTSSEKRKLSTLNLNIFAPQKYEVDLKDKHAGDAGSTDASAEGISGKERDIRTMFVAAPSDSTESLSSKRAVTTNELSKNEADPLIPTFLTSEGKTDIGEEAGAENGAGVFRSFRDLEFIEQAEDLEERPIGEPYRDEFGRRFLVECKSLTIGDVGHLEPFFITLALYDLGAKKKISENFHVDLNADESMDLIRGHVNGKDLLSMSKHALFQTNFVNQDIYLVVRIEKVLEGEPGPVFERYMAGVGKKAGKDVVGEFCDRLGKYRQPFAWGFVQLFNEDLDLDLGQDTLDDCMIKPLFRQDGEKIGDEELLATIISLNSAKGTKKAKNVTGEFRFKISEVEDEQPTNSFTPHLVPVKPFSNDSDKIVREVEEFPQNLIVRPQIDYVNTLYVYPTSLNMTKYQGQSSARNIAVKVQFVPSAESDKAPGSNAVKAIFGKSSSKVFVTEAWAAVNFHSKTPTFYEEIKIAIPLNLTKTHHVLFSFYHVGCKVKKGQPTEETLLGYSWLPILENGHIIGDSVLNLPIASELDKQYDTSTANKYMDGKKPLFSVRTKLVSSMYTHDPHVTSFFNALQDASRGSSTGDGLAKALQQLLEANKAILVQFSPVLFDELFGILSRNFTNESVYIHAFHALIHVVATVHTEKASGAKRDPSLVSYVKYRYSNKAAAQRSVFEEIIRLMLYYLENLTTDPIVKELERYSWFFFEICIKSSLQHLNSNCQWKPGMIPEPKTWFKPEHVKFIKKLYPLLTQEVLKHSKTSLIIGKELNESMAYFLNDMSVCFERKMIFKLVQHHVGEITFNDTEVLLSFKFDFLRIICGYEHFVALNLPTSDYLEKPFEKLSTIEKDFWKRHFLVGLLLHEVDVMIDHPNRLTRLKAISTLKEVIGKHDADPRIDTKEKRTRVAGMYFPLLSILIRHYPAISDEKTEEYSFNNTERRAILVCFLYVIRSLDTKWLFEWLRKETVQNFSTFIDILGLCVNTFQYLGKDAISERHSKGEKKGNLASDMKRQFENFYANSMQSRLAARTTGGSVKSGTLGKAAKGSLSSRSSVSRRSQNSSSVRNTLSKSKNPALELADEIRLEGSLASEVSLVVLDLLETILHAHNPKEKDTVQAAKMFELLSRLLDKNQSEKVLLRLFNTTKTFIFKFALPIFKESNVFASELCRLVLRYCASVITPVRQYASALFFLLLKKNFEATNKDNFMKVRIQTTVALNKLSLKDDEHLRRSFATVLEYAMAEKDLAKTKFPALVKDAIDKLFVILRDSVKMNDFVGDIDMLCDMHYRIAKGYMNAPDLRLASLEMLKGLHFKEENFAEMAICILHSAALVAQCLQTMKNKHKHDIDLRGAPNGAKAFAFISPNFLEEEGASTEGDGIGESPAFSERGLMNLLDSSIHQLAKANLYEIINDVYKLLIPMHEKSKDWTLLSADHFTLHKHLTELVKLNQSGKRFLGTYFRVAFFGKLFGTLAGQEYIYKEKKITRLADISLRLEQYYSEKFKPENFELITDSATVDVSKLDPSKAYLQITFVEPYFTEEELKTRTTMFERNSQIDTFFYETPYTKDGKAHGGVDVQWKRKTILKTEHYFPYVKRRQPVVSQKIIEMSPLEVSVESIGKRCEALQAAITAKEPKSLQVVLQGSVRLQVNAGPLEIATTFLAPSNVAKYDKAQIKQLMQNFANFLRLCFEALNLNRNLVKSDQRAYQEDLEEGYDDVRRQLVQYIDTSLVSDLGGKGSAGMPGAKSVLDVISGFDTDTMSFTI